MPNPRAAAGLTILGFLATACDTYDPPPEVRLLEAEDGNRFAKTPLVFEFTEAVEPSTVRLSMWPDKLTHEGDIPPDAQAVLDACGVGQGTCGSAVLSVAADGLTASLDPGDQFIGREGKPFIIDVHGGLSDLAGRLRDVPTRFPLLVSPEPVVIDPTEPLPEIQLGMSTGIVVMVANLTDIVSGVYLRMYLDVGALPTTGETWILATVAGKSPDAANNTTNPLEHAPKISDEGWVLMLKGTISKLADGRFYLLTTPQDIDINVLGIIRVRLEQLALEATFVAGGSADKRDLFEGFMTASKALMGNGEDEVELNDGLPVNSNWVAEGLDAHELPDKLPRLCDPKPCQSVLDVGGECHLEKPWVSPAVCTPPE